MSTIAFNCDFCSKLKTCDHVPKDHLWVMKDGKVGNTCFVEIPKKFSEKDFNRKKRVRKGK